MLPVVELERGSPAMALELRKPLIPCFRGRHSRQAGRQP